MKKILGVFVSLFVLAMLAIPVMAAPATTKEATLTRAGGGAPVPFPGYPRFVSDGTISHAKGTSPPGATATLIIGDDTYEGDWYGEWIANANWKKGEFVITSKNTLTFDEGTFVGVNQRRITGISPFHPDAIFEDRAVYRGIDGMFKGWTLKVSREGLSTVPTEGYVIIPK